MDYFSHWGLLLSDHSFLFFFISAKYTQALVHIVTRLFWYPIYVQGSTGEALENGMTPEWSKQKVFLCFLLWEIQQTFAEVLGVQVRYFWVSDCLTSLCQYFKAADLLTEELPTTDRTIKFIYFKLDCEK